MITIGVFALHKPRRFMICSAFCALD